MARKRTSDEANTLLWYRLECFKRSPYFKWLQARLQEDEDGSRLERVALFQEIVRLAPLVPIESDGLRWVTVKLDLNAPIPVVLASLENLLKEMQDE